ncbi:hypothetical protein TNIN_112471 [Trichonephila inaurata madagascariensis]|uniref:Uncharacterized protein n=1 Tax=Trichonephila inaurata madagascariensis TaxID=2747483 RepID=A0A8X6WLZ3_9ARAC|nr:hypothetical protein TNIN_112471 [Trichonephila inaurata madagascariensis]
MMSSPKPLLRFYLLDQWISRSSNKWFQLPSHVIRESLYNSLRVRRSTLLLLSHLRFLTLFVFPPQQAVRRSQPLDSSQTEKVGVISYDTTGKRVQK